MLPALCYAERDRAEGRLPADEERDALQATDSLLEDVAALIRVGHAASAPKDVSGRDQHIRILGVPASGEADRLALNMLASLLHDTSFAMDMMPPEALSSALVTRLQDRNYGVICLADLPPSPPSKTRYLVKKLKTAAPNVQILVGRWAPPALRDSDSRALVDAGAVYVAGTLMENPRSAVSPGAGAALDRRCRLSADLKTLAARRGSERHAPDRPWTKS